MPTPDQVTTQLRKVIDPEMGINIVDMGLIYDINIVPQPDMPDKYKVIVIMTLTSPGCPLASLIDDLVTSTVGQLPDIQSVYIDLTFDPPWNIGKMTAAARAELGFF